MSERVFVTGLGIISSIGNNTQENLEALLNGFSGIGPSIRLQSGMASDFLFGEVNVSNRELADKHFCNNAHKNSRTALLGLTAAHEAIISASFNKKHLKDFGLINGTSVGGMDVSELYYNDLINGKDVDYNKAFGAHDCGFSTEFIADSLGINGFISTVSTACSSSANSIAFATRLIKAGRIKRALAGGADALTNFTFHGFNSLMILDPKRSKPFDEQRRGLNLGEGAAFLVLESERSVHERKVKPIAEVKGYGNANDAFHQTASSPEGTGASMAMENALQIAKMKIMDISYINAHGTGTKNNDLSECIALQNIFGKSMPDYSSTKSYTGHTLGAAGAIEAVFSILAIDKGVAFANNKIEETMDVLLKPPLQKNLKETKIKSVLSNSFGFGGNCTSLIFKEVS